MPGQEAYICGVIEKLLPAVVAVAEAVDDESPDPLFDEEDEALGGAVPHRRVEFATGRSCARRALSALGQPPRPILPGSHREPLWPDGFVGSITHCSGYCAAAVARVEEIATIGVDAEIDEPLPPGILDKIALPGELAWVRARTGDGMCWDRLLFSAKESVFKAWFPLAGRWLGFEHARVSFDAATGTFDARLLVDGPRVGGIEVRGFSGRFRAGAGLVLTALTMAQPFSGSSAPAPSAAAATAARRGRPWRTPT
jgi:4'-phosphopantetheinyl transferase EntD